MIYIDPRAGSQNLIPVLGKMGIPVIPRQLDFGDVHFDLNGPDDLPIPVGIEHKKVGDLLSCITSKRFTGFQLPGMCRTYKIRVLMIEGAMRRGPNGPNCPNGGMLQVPMGRDWADHPSRMVYTDVIEWLTGICFQTNTHLWFTRSLEDSAHHIFGMAKYAFKKFDAHNSLNVFHEPEELAMGVSFKPITRRRRFAALLPDIGWEKSDGAATVFPSIGAMANATPEEWTKVEYGRTRKMKISLKTAKKIVQAIWGAD